LDFLIVPSEQIVNAQIPHHSVWEEVAVVVVSDFLIVNEPISNGWRFHRHLLLENVQRCVNHYFWFLVEVFDSVALVLFSQ
jgi:hypothetical protein